MQKYDEIISERHVQAIWYDGALRPEGLRTADGAPVRVVDPGRWNLEAGPDFRDAVLEIGDEVTTIGGIVGRVVAIKDDEDALIIETGSDRVKMKFRKWCISSVDTVKEMPKTDEKKGLFSGFGKKKKDNPAEDKKPE